MRSGVNANRIGFGAVNGWNWLLLGEKNMGCVTATAKRRRKQAVNGYRDMHPMRRPRYAIPTPVASQRREERKAKARAGLQGGKRQGR